MVHWQVATPGGFMAMTRSVFHLPARAVAAQAFPQCWADCRLMNFFFLPARLTPQNMHFQQTSLPQSIMVNPLPYGTQHIQRSTPRSEEHTSELQSPCNLVCRLLLEKKKQNKTNFTKQ